MKKNSPSESPWDFIPNGKDLIVIDAAGALIACNRPSNKEDLEQILIDFRLISAAPELLEACHVALERIDYGVDARINLLLKSAIAKAEGKPSE